MLQEFIDFLNSQVDKGLYVLGAQTESIKDGTVYRNGKSLGTLKAWMSSIGQTATAYNTVNSLYKARIKRLGNIELRIFDCSGLGMSWLYNLKHIASSDLTANGMMGKCKKISKSELKKGDWVFRVYTSGSKKGRAYHIGYVVDDNLSVVEDYGKSKGVIKRPLDTSYWNTYGRPSYFRDEIEHEEEPKVVFTRVLKRVKPTMTGEDVRCLQKMLNDYGGYCLALDGRCGPATEKAIRSFQKSYGKGLVVDGKAGKNTITALGGIWKK